ncbi:serine/threonine dehydratase [Kineococcus rhizosphaerae]|uniref:L-threonine ammonia-lyase n=1 Tax=Kineococcus rhizosphaerae TaxID=559628 RepID=A0A2T0QZR1_9ACTN|nr:serine/threonine dehydratase [Kineococcus rhizosphaerae]PRY12177.1 L-threonine ammonia-lyase [Kineococcus rhizosphaerae]
MQTITAADVTTAATRTTGRVRRTPVLQVAPDLWLKLEFLQHTGTFKARGALNRQLAARERGELDPDRGVVAASGGNAGLAHAHAAAQLGVPATVFVPESAPVVKVRKLRDLGADVRLVGEQYAQAYEAAVAYADERGAVFCHAYDQPEVAAGAGTLALEVLQDVPDVDTVVVAVGGGGLFAGVAAGLDGAARVVAVEPTGAPTLHDALAAGEPVDVDVSGVAADSLGARRIGEIGFTVARRTNPVSLLVDDAAIVAARRDLWSRFRVVAEHGAAAAWAGLDAYHPADGERVVVVVCGANTDPADLG